MHLEQEATQQPDQSHAAALERTLRRTCRCEPLGQGQHTVIRRQRDQHTVGAEPLLEKRQERAEVAVQVLRPRVAELAARMPVKQAPDLSRYLLSPMPGLLVELAVAAGQEVKAGEVLAVVEAMKMENVLRAERDGAIAKIHAEPGASLAVDQPILEFA